MANFFKTLGIILIFFVLVYTIIDNYAIGSRCAGEGSKDDCTNIAKNLGRRVFGIDNIIKQDIENMQKTDSSFEKTVLKVDIFASLFTFVTILVFLFSASMFMLGKQQVEPFAKFMILMAIFGFYFFIEVVYSAFVEKQFAIPFQGFYLAFKNLGLFIK